VAPRRCAGRAPGRTWPRWRRARRCPEVPQRSSAHARAERGAARSTHIQSTLHLGLHVALQRSRDRVERGHELRTGRHVPEQQPARTRTSAPPSRACARWGARSAPTYAEPRACSAWRRRARRRRRSTRSCARCAALSPKRSARPHWREGAPDPAGSGDALGHRRVLHVLHCLLGLRALLRDQAAHA
jgi:hypothetical protein